MKLLKCIFCIIFNKKQMKFLPSLKHDFNYYLNFGPQTSFPFSGIFYWLLFKFKNIFESFTGYSFFQFSDALLSSSLFVICFKLFFALFEFRPSFFFNLVIMFIGIFISLKYDVSKKLRKKLKYKISTFLGDSFTSSNSYFNGFDFPDDDYFHTIKYVRYFTHVSHLSNLDYQDDLGYMFSKMIKIFQMKEKPLEGSWQYKLFDKISHFYAVFCFCCYSFFQIIFFFFIFIRLCILAEPIIFFIFNFLLISLLLTNKLFLIAALFSLFFWISRIIFFMSDGTFSYFKRNISPIFPKILDGYAIKPTWTNVKVVGMYLFHNFDPYWKNQLHFLAYRDIDIRMEVIGLILDIHKARIFYPNILFTATYHEKNLLLKTVISLGLYRKE